MLVDSDTGALAHRSVERIIGNVNFHHDSRVTPVEHPRGDRAIQVKRSMQGAGPQGRVHYLVKEIGARSSCAIQASGGPTFQTTRSWGLQSQRGSVRGELRVHPRCKNGSCQITHFEIFGREKCCMIEQEPVLQWVNLLVPQ